MKNLVNLKGAKMLSRIEQKSINGGAAGSCAIQLNGEVWVGLSLGRVNQAISSMSSGDSLQWCCDSCSTASWMNE